MKLILPALLAAAAISVATIAPASAVPASHQECTTTSNNSEVPSGTYTSPTGKKWAGFKQDGMPPDSLTASGGSSTTCVTVQDVV